MAAARHGSGWVTAPVSSPFGSRRDSPLAAVSAGARRVNVFFIDGRRQAGRSGPGPAGLAGQRTARTAGQDTPLAATSYLLGAQSTASGPARLGTAVYYLTRSGRPATTYSAGGQPWRSAVLPGTATRILGADAYQAAGEPSRVFLPSGRARQPARSPGRGARTRRPVGRAVPDAVLNAAAASGAVAGRLLPGSILPGGPLASEKATRRENGAMIARIWRGWAPQGTSR